VRGASRLKPQQKKGKKNVLSNREMYGSKGAIKRELTTLQMGSILTTRSKTRVGEKKKKRCSFRCLEFRQGLLRKLGEYIEALLSRRGKLRRFGEYRHKGGRKVAHKGARKIGTGMHCKGCLRRGNNEIKF